MYSYSLSPSAPESEAQPDFLPHQGHLEKSGDILVIMTGLVGAIGR